MIIIVYFCILTFKNFICFILPKKNIFVYSLFYICYNIIYRTIHFANFKVSNSVHQGEVISHQLFSFCIDAGALYAWAFA